MSASDLFIGREMGGFVIQERIGRGGMATVYRAYQPSVNRSVALKVITLDPSQSEREEFRRRFAHEAKVIAELEHIHILPIYDYGIVDNEFAYIAMRLLKGGSLADLLQGQPMPTDRMAEIFTQMARGLAFAHSKNVLHRDLKPSNIMLDDAGNAYLTDFGLAKSMDSSMDLTRTGHIVGTPVYMSPEQLRGETLDARSDIYSLGVILYHMLVGKPPFDASDTNMVSVIYQHLEKDPVPPRDIIANIPEAVETVALKALRKDRTRRYDTADEMANALNIALGRRISSTQYTVVPPPPATQPSIPISVTAPAAKGARMLAVIGAAVVLLLVALIAVVALQPTITTPIQSATVVPGSRGRAQDVVPTEAEVARAQQRLGANGFAAYVTCNQSSTYHATQIREMGDFARAYGMTFRVYDSNNNPDNQLIQIERARTDGATLLILCPLNNELLRDTLTSVQAANLPLVLMSSSINPYGGVLVAGDDYLMGVEAGRAAGRIVRDELGGRARAIILDFPSLPNIALRADGLADGIREVARSVNIVGRYPGATDEGGYNSVKRLLDEGVAFNVILSINDAGSYGAVRALEEAGVAPDEVIIASVDAEPQARQFMQAGRYMRASVDVGRENFSRVAIDIAVKLLAGATVVETVLVPPLGVITAETLAAATPTPGT